MNASLEPELETADADRPTAATLPAKLENSVDQALFGLAQRLTESDEGASSRREQWMDTEPTTQLVVLGLPQKAGRLPSMERLKPRRPRRSSARPKPPPKTERSTQGRVEFTILKSRRGEREFAEPTGARQDSKTGGEQAKTGVRKRRRRGVSFVGWLLLIALSTAAAAIAYLTPGWF